MIRPRLPKIAGGTKLTTNLINAIINRTEYAADLLRQYKLIAGTEMYVEPHYDGTRVSYLQPVGGGATPTQPISPSGKYRIIGDSSAGYYVYDPSKNTLEFLASGYNPLGIKGNLICGTINLGLGVGNRAFLYNGETYTLYQHPNANTFNGTYGLHLYDNFICGYYQKEDEYSNFYGYILNINTGTFTDFNYGGPYTETYINGIYENYLCGVSYGISIQVAWFYNGSNFVILQQYPPNNPELQFVEPLSVSKNYVVGYADILTDTGYQTKGYIYNINTEEILLKSYPDSLTTDFFDIHNENLIVGRAVIGGINRAIIYDLAKDQFSLIESPNPEITFNFARGIG